MLQPCPRNVGLAEFLNGTSKDHGNEEDLLTLGRQRCKDIPSGRAVAIGLWRLLHMIIGCGRYKILCFSRCTLVDRVKSCISFACALKGLPSGRQALTLTLIPEVQMCHGSLQQIAFEVPTTLRIIHRKWISSLTIYGYIWRDQGPAPKQAIGVTMPSKNFTVFLMEKFLLRKIYLLARARLADCKPLPKSRVACLEPAADNMQPNHL